MKWLRRLLFEGVEGARAPPEPHTRGLRNHTSEAELLFEGVEGRCAARRGHSLPRACEHTTL